MWEADTAGVSGVAYGQQGQAQAYRESTPQRLPGKDAAYLHKLWIEGLQPGSVYRYRITGPGAGSATFAFRTTPARTEDVRFIVYGDSRTRPRVHRRLVEQMTKHPVDFIVHTGDLTSDGDDYRLWGPQFFEPLRGLAERVPIYTVKGNHEGRDGMYEKLLVPPGEEDSFAFEFGPLHYSCIDNVSGRQSNSELVARIVQGAMGGQARWKFVSYHVPSVNFGGHKSAWQRQEVLPAFAQAGIDFVVTGHSHQYERFRPLEPPDAGNWVTYMTTGGGGAPLASVRPTPYHAYARTVHHFCLFHIQGDRLTLEVIDPEGRTVDRLAITKKDGRLDGPYRATAIPMDKILSSR
jgi:predicted phosphodiesterase